jgi:subtilisin family serine protease
LYAVKVLNASGSGTNSGVISGMNYVATDSQTRSCPKGTVANMSLGGSKSTAVNSAAAAMVDAGVFLAVAAGNDGANAANSSPASETTVCTVGATEKTDALASYSNFGAVVDILAPGTNILSSWIGSNSATNTISGTSMATPHITGLGAYLLALNGAQTPAALCAYVSDNWMFYHVNCSHMHDVRNHDKEANLGYSFRFKAPPPRARSLVFPLTPRTTLLLMAIPA